MPFTQTQRQGEGEFEIPQNLRTGTDPYQRVMASPSVAEETKTQLKVLFETLNPFTLRKKIQEKLKGIFFVVRLP